MLIIKHFKIRIMLLLFYDVIEIAFLAQNWDERHPI